MDHGQTGQTCRRTHRPTVCKAVHVRAIRNAGFYGHIMNALRSTMQGRYIFQYLGNVLAKKSCFTVCVTRTIHFWARYSHCFLLTETFSKPLEEKTSESFIVGVRLSRKIHKM